MNQEFSQTHFSLASLTGLLGGITGAVFNFALFILFAGPAVENGTTALFNPFTISFGSIFPPLLAGMFYSGFINSRVAGIIYYLLFGGCYLWLIVLSGKWHYFADHEAERQFHNLLYCMIGVIGIFTLLIPFFIRNRQMLTKVI